MSEIKIDDLINSSDFNALELSIRTTNILRERFTKISDIVRLSREEFLHGSERFVSRTSFNELVDALNTFGIKHNLGEPLGYQRPKTIGVVKSLVRINLNGRNHDITEEEAIELRDKLIALNL